MAELIIQSGKLQGRRVILPDREVNVGRDEECQMRIASSLVSRKHCTLKATPEGIWVRDLGSQNGTYVNDVAISELFLLKPGDLLRIGSSIFQVPRVKHSSQQASSNEAGSEEESSDDNISHWLTGDEPTMKAGIPETEIVKGRQSSPSNPSVTDVPVATASEASDPSTDPRGALAASQRPQSIKEQASEIIRRHWESVRAKK